MAGDESLVFMVAVMVAVAGALLHLAPLWLGVPLRPLSRVRARVLQVGVAGFVVLYLTLTTLASFDVRDSGLYQAFYLTFGAAWTMAALGVFERLDLSLVHDAIMRNNEAALAALSGVGLGVVFAFAGGNIGDGPGWWCVLVAAGLATAGLVATWLALHFVAGAAEAITVERDVASGVRVGALMVAGGLLLGRAAAGDWVSLADTLRSFVLMGLPGFIVLGMGVGFERVLLRHRTEPVSRSVLPAYAYVGTALALLPVLGAP